MLIWQAASPTGPRGWARWTRCARACRCAWPAWCCWARPAGFAWAIARTTEYTITNQRCLLSFGVALNAKLSVPLRRLAAISVAAGPDGCGNIALRPKPGSG